VKWELSVLRSRRRALASNDTHHDTYPTVSGSVTTKEVKVLMTSGRTVYTLTLAPEAALRLANDLVDIEARIR